MDGEGGERARCLYNFVATSRRRRRRGVVFRSHLVISNANLALGSNAKQQQELAKAIGVDIHDRLAPFRVLLPSRFPLWVCVLLGPWLATTQRNASASITASRRLVKISKIDHTPKEEEHAPVLLFTAVCLCLYEETFSFSDSSVTTSTCSCLGTI